MIAGSIQSIQRNTRAYSLPACSIIDNYIMKTLSDLKKALIQGARIEMLTYNGHTPPEKIQGVREVVKVQTNGVYLAHPENSIKSFFDFPKANAIKFYSDTRFTVWDYTKDGLVWCTREYVIHNKN